MTETAKPKAVQTEPADEAVGYGKPPARHRFQKGRSGNPRGRPRGQLASLGRRDLLEAFARTARKPIQVSINGRATTTSQYEALVQQIYVKGMKGDLGYARLYLDMTAKLVPVVDTCQEPGPNLTVRFVRAGEVKLKPDES